MILAHKIRLYPNDKQATYFRKACGISRFAYNWALGESRRRDEEGTSASGYDLSARLNAIKQERYPWMYEVTKWSPQMAVYNAFDALKRWWKGTSQAPRFKKKGKSKDAFYLGIASVNTRGKRIYIAGLGWVRTTQALRFAGKIISATVSCVAGFWFASVVVQCPERRSTNKTNTVGVDVGIKNLAVTSDGTVYANPKATPTNQRKLRHLNQDLSRKQRGSQNKKQAAQKVAKQHYKISCIRKDAQHKTTTAIIKSCGIVCFESLNIKGMVRNRRLSKALSDAALGELHRQLTYKADLTDVLVVRADPFFPSSKRCSQCGEVKKELALSQRTYVCDACGLVLDRDLNAARNLKQLAVRYTDSQNACGDGSAGVDFRVGTKLLSAKQEAGDSPRLLTDLVEV